MIEARGLTKDYGEKRAVDDLTLASETRTSARRKRGASRRTR